MKRELLIAGLFWGLVALAGWCWGETTMLEFSATWCGPCQQMAPVIERIEREGYTVRRVDVDREAALAQRYGVTSIPCFVFVDREKEIDRAVGIMAYEQLKIKFHAWRYEPPIGYRSAVVRIYCREKAPKAAYGSGVYVRWGNTALIVTARHVIKDAREVWVLTHPGKWHRAHVLNADAVWDCAVLDCDLPEIKPCELQFGSGAILAADMRLESCGYGPDGKLAVNDGRFLGYKRSNERQLGPDDWFEISGHARPGDSGGPIFNSQGRVVGVLWGTNGQAVIGVQPGRLQIAIKDALTHRKMAFEPGVYRATQCGPNGCGPGGCNRQPTPPMDGPEGSPGSPPPEEWVSPDAATSGGPILKWRKEQEQKERAIAAQIDGLQRQIAELTTALRQAQQTPSAPGAPTGPSANEIALQNQLAQLQAQLAASQNQQAAAKESPGNAFEKKLDDFLHKLPIQGPVTKLEEQQLESKPALERFFGATAAIVFITLVGTAVVGAVVMLGHKIYQKCHADLPAIQAKLGTIPGIGAGLAAGMGTLDAANTTLDAKLQAALADLKTHMTGLLTPAPGQGTSTPPVSVNVTPSK